MTENRIDHRFETIAQVDTEDLKPGYISNICLVTSSDNPVNWNEDTIIKSVPSCDNFHSQHTIMTWKHECPIISSHKSSYLKVTCQKWAFCLVFAGKKIIIILKFKVHLKPHFFCKAFHKGGGCFSPDHFLHLYSLFVIVLLHWQVSHHLLLAVASRTILTVQPCLTLLNTVLQLVTSCLLMIAPSQPPSLAL